MNINPPRTSGLGVLKSVLLWSGSTALVAMAYNAFGWAGVAMAVGGLIFWLLLHFTRLMTIMKRAANRPIGYVDSAVMLHTKLQAGMTLLQIITLTKSLGERLSAEGLALNVPEHWRWSDASGHAVHVTLQNAKLVHFELRRAENAGNSEADAQA